MNKESLILAREKIIEVLSSSAISDIDKVELMINLNHFLEPADYDTNIKVLAKTKKPITGPLAQ